MTRPMTASEYASVMLRHVYDVGPHGEKPDITLADVVHLLHRDLAELSDDEQEWRNTAIDRALAAYDVPPTGKTRRRLERVVAVVMDGDVK